MGYDCYYINVADMNWRQPHAVTRSKLDKAYLTVVEQNFNDEPFHKLARWGSKTKSRSGLEDIEDYHYDDDGSRPAKRLKTYHQPDPAFTKIQ